MILSAMTVFALFVCIEYINDKDGKTAMFKCQVYLWLKYTGIKRLLNSEDKTL